MRRSLLACRTGLTVAAALVLVSACGGSEEDGAASPSSSAPAASSSSSAAGSEAPQAGSQFCTEAESLLTALDTAFQDSADTATLPQLFQQTAAGMRSIDAPDEIAGDWGTLADGLDQYAAAFEGLDLSDPASLEQFEQRTAGLEQQLTASGDNVEGYLSEQCGITGESESAAPSS